MAWDHLSINRPHLVYIILGGFTSLFMLCSSIIKEKLYIGEATVATLCGIIFGPHAANLVNPLEWGNTDQITLEFSRIVLVVQCFAVGVELPKAYMERHWRSIFLLLIPVMTFGWLITSLFVWWQFGDRLNWLDSLVIAACVTATDPVLASSVVGKGKFAKRVPKHLRDLLSAESGCNDGMAFPFVYIGIYLIRYHMDAKHVTFHFVCYTILYEVIFGAVYGFLIGYIARRAIRAAHEKDLIDRESFLVFYFVLALFCAGSGSILGMDDLLVGFACGVGFSNDGWFQEKTEESHVSNVIDLLINLAFFVYFGSIIPWNQFNTDILGTSPGRLVIVAVMVIFFRRIPIMMILKPIVPDIKTWREALFAGHFGPIGVGAIFIAILARAEFETETTTPLAVLPPRDFPHANIIELIWPITCFLVITSILIHGSSIAVWTLGKHINTLTLTFSYTQQPEDGPNWMERLPRIQSRSRTSMSLPRRPDGSQVSLDEKDEDQQQGGILNIPKGFLRRQKEEDQPGKAVSRKKRSKWDSGRGPGGPISSSAIAPASQFKDQEKDTSSGDLADQTPSSDGSPSPRAEVYDESGNLIVEDEQGDVLDIVEERPGESHAAAVRRANREAKQDLKSHAQESDLPADKDQASKEDPHPYTEDRPGWRKRMESFSMGRRPSEAPVAQSRTRHGPARAYTYGNTVIVEDEDGEVIKTYEIPSKPGERKGTVAEGMIGKGTLEMLNKMGSYFGANPNSAAGPSQDNTDVEKQAPPATPDVDDNKIRFTLGDSGRRLRKDEFIEELVKMETRGRARSVVDSQQVSTKQKLDVAQKADLLPTPDRGSKESLHHTKTTETIPSHAVADSLAGYSFGKSGEQTAAQRRRQEAGEPRRPIAPHHDEEESEYSEDERFKPTPAAKNAAAAAVTLSTGSTNPQQGRTSPGRGSPNDTSGAYLEDQETAAERRRRQAALGMTDEDDSSDDDDGSGFREPKARGGGAPGRSSPTAATATSTDNNGESGGNGQSAGMRLRWGADVGKKP